VCFFWPAIDYTELCFVMSRTRAAVPQYARAEAALLSDGKKGTMMKTAKASVGRRGSMRAMPALLLL